MIGLVLVTHGRLAEEMRLAMEHVVGRQRNVATVCIGPEDDMEGRRSEIHRRIEEVDTGDGVVLLTDMFGGTPSNLAISQMDRKGVEVLAGMNLPMLVKLAKINAHHVSLFAYLIEKLQATPDGDGSLLDHTLYMLGSGMGNPDVHDHSNLPIVVAGGRGSQFKGGRHIRFDKPTPLANLHLTLLDKVGVHLDSFVDSTGRVEGLEPLNV